MHQPETWGYLQFSDITFGTNNIPFSFNTDEICKWELRKIYYSQNDFKLKYGYYSSNIIGLDAISSACINPIIQLSDTSIGYQYKMSCNSCMSIWVIENDGKISPEHTKK